MNPRKQSSDQYCFDGVLSNIIIHYYTKKMSENLSEKLVQMPCNRCGSKEKTLCTTDSDSVCEGSNPSPAATRKPCNCNGYRVFLLRIF